MKQITSELIEAGRSERGGWTKAQFALIGVAWPPEKHWKVAVIGQRISEEDAAAFVGMRNGANPQQVALL